MYIITVLYTLYAQSISNIGEIFNIRYSFTPAPDERAAYYHVRPSFRWTPDDFWFWQIRDIFLIHSRSGRPLSIHRRLRCRLVVYTAPTVRVAYRSHHNVFCVMARRPYVYIHLYTHIYLCVCVRAHSHICMYIMLLFLRYTHTIVYNTIDYLLKKKNNNIPIVPRNRKVNTDKL